MCITGSLTDFSLPEICRLLNQGHHTGLLTLQTEFCPQSSSSPSAQIRIFYIWVYQGNIVSITNRRKCQGLIALIKQHQQLEQSNLTKLVESCPPHKALGSWLKHKGILTAKQLKLLFHHQVLQPIYTLFQVQVGNFKFQHNVPIPTREMTGLSLNMGTATLIGLRKLQNWTALANKLPDSSAGLVSIIEGQPQYHLEPLEWQIWEYTKGTVSLLGIARQLRIPVQKVRQIAFRLISVGLAEEIPLTVKSPSSQTDTPLPALLAREAQNRHISKSFLQNLVGFLSTKSKRPISQFS